MIEYLQALNAVRQIFSQFPEVKELIKLELNNQGTEYVEFHENEHKQIEQPQAGAVPTDGDGSPVEVPHETGS